MTDARREFKIKVVALDRDCIVAAGYGEGVTFCEGEVQAHHVIYQKHLLGRGLEELLWDANNGAAVCERHHRRHHNGRERIPQSALPERCHRFAYDHDLQFFLERFYTLRA